MDSYRRRQIQAKALEVLKDAGVSSLPVKPIEIAEHLEITVEAKPPSMSGASGWLICNGDRFAIVYATHIDNLGFQNFSIAHEIGHYCLDGHPEHIFKNGNEHMSRAGFSSADAIEQEADYFAACLLMPKPMCLPLINKNSDGMAAVTSLAMKCETSLVASALRYAEIGHLPAGVIQCHNGRVEFCATHTLLAHVGWARPLPRNTKVPSDSATQRLSEDREAVVHGGEDSDSAPASDWFSGASGKHGLSEEVIGLGKFGRTLTVLTLEAAEDYEEEESEYWADSRFH